MPGTLRYNLRITDKFGTRSRTPVDGGANITVAADPRSAGQMSVIITGQGEVIPVADVATSGFLYMRNDDPTNFIEWGPDDGGGNIVVVGQIEPGEEVWFRASPAATVRVRADTAACPLTFELWSA